MKYSQIVAFEKAFKSFLIQYNRKPVITIHYYRDYDRLKHSDCSFIGYETTSRGLHGIHYNGTKKTYHFGTRNNEIKSEIHMLMPPQIASIPSHLRDGMLDAANKKIRKIIRKDWL